MCWTYFKTIGHRLKILSLSQNILSTPLVSQSGSGLVGSILTLLCVAGYFQVGMKKIFSCEHKFYASAL